jgi:hypothetical protein
MRRICTLTLFLLLNFILIAAPAFAQGNSEHVRGHPTAASCDSRLALQRANNAQAAQIREDAAPVFAHRADIVDGV